MRLTSTLEEISLPVSHPNTLQGPSKLGEKKGKSAFRRTGVFIFTGTPSVEFLNSPFLLDEWK